MIETRTTGRISGGEYNMEQKKKISPKQAAALIIAVVVLILGGIGGYFLYQNNKIETPEKRLEKYFSLANDKAYDKMYDMLSEESQSTISKEDFAEKNKNFYDSMEANQIQIVIAEDEKSNSKRESARTLSYQITMNTLAGELSFQNSAILSKNKDKVYMLDWTSQDLYPHLKEGEEIKAETIYPERGKIYDRNGVMLAGDGTASSVGIVPGKLPEDRDAAITQIAEYLEVSTDKIENALGAGWVKDDLFVPIRTIAKTEEELKAKLLTVPGVKISDTTVRSYPLGQAAAQVVGYTQNITAEELKEHAGEGYTSASQIGKGGIEKVYEKELHGTTGCKISVADREGNEKEVILEQEGANGTDITLTIDSILQSQMYRQLSEEKGWGIAMNPKTGEVLALVSTPAYNPNDFVLGYTSEAWENINNDPAKPLYNRCRSTWAPGSVFKPIVAVLGLTQGSLTSGTEAVYEGLKWQKDSSWGNYFVTTLTEYSPKDLQNALVYSDNIYFAQAALDMGTENFQKGLDSVGFGETVPFDIEYKSSSYGEEGKIDSETELADSGYGQGKILVNPLHLAAMYSAFSNDGSMIAPYLTMGKEKTYWKENVFTPEAAQTVWDNMVQVVDNPEGTGHEAMIEGKTIAGKTGTAEIKDSKDDTTGTELGYFIGIRGGDENSSLLIGMMVEDVKDRGGSHYVVPKVRECFANYK
jgi:cell division protein FtsI/penicillin-binding protein 2